MSSSTAVLLTHQGLFDDNVKYTFRQLYHAVGRITQGYRYTTPEGVVVADLYPRWKSLEGPGIYEAYQRAAFRMHGLWKNHKGKLAPMTESEARFTGLDYRVFSQNNMTQCLAYVLYNQREELSGMTLPEEHVVVNFRPSNDEWSIDFIRGVLHQKAEENRYLMIPLANGEQAYWNLLEGDVMEIIMADATRKVGERWGQGLFAGRYSEVYYKIGTIFRESMETILQERVTQQRDDLFGIKVKTTPDTPPYPGGSPASSSSGDSGSSGYNPAASMDMD